MPDLLHLETGAVTRFDAPGLGRLLESGAVEPLPSLHALKDTWWALYLQDRSWRLHVAAGFEVRVNGRVTGGGELQRGDVVGDGDGHWRFLDGDWPGARHPGLDEKALTAPDDDALALVYRDWALEQGAPLAEALRRPVARAEQARHLWSLGPAIADGLVDVDFAGPFVRRVVTRDPRLELTGFVDALARCASALEHLHVVRTLGLSTDDGVQLALLLARAPALRQLQTLESGQRGAWVLEDFRQQDERDPHSREVASLRSPREGPARPVTLEVVEWDGWTSVEPLTSARAVLLDGDRSLISAPPEGARLTQFDPRAEISLRRGDDWILEVKPSVPASLLPSRAGLPVRGAIGLALGERFELVPGLGCRLTPAR